MNTTAKWILQSLERIEPYALPQSALFEEVKVKVRPPLQLGAFKKLISEMERDQLIGRLEEKYEDEPKWLIREAGKTLLRR